MQYLLAHTARAIVAGAALLSGSLLGLSQAAVAGAEAANPPGPSATDVPPGPSAGIVIVGVADYPPGPTADGIIVSQ